MLHLTNEFLSYDFLNAQECSDICNVILSHKSSWGNASSTYGMKTETFYYLGYPHYLTMQTSKDVLNYKINASRGNKLVAKIFPDLLGKFRQKCEEVLGEKVTLGDEFEIGSPGFHIIPAKIDTSPRAYHIDNQYFSLSEILHVDKTFAMGVNVSLNCSKEKPYIEFSDQYFTGTESSYLAPGNIVPEKISYKTGKINFFNGFRYHRIGPSLVEEPGHYRLTLQSTLIRIDGKLVLYW